MGIKFLATFIGLVVLGLSSSAYANICAGRINGEQVPDPLDCSAFYVCDHGKPLLVRCHGHLRYDPRIRVCNWPQYVTCFSGETYQHPPLDQQYYGQAQPDYNYNNNYNNYNNNNNNNNYQTQPIVPRPPPPPPPPAQPHPDYPVTDNDPNHFYPGILTSPNDPYGYECTLDGFYFVPHPYSCEKYFICENRRIHYHQCAPGIHWDYVYLQCDFPNRAYCYGNSTYIPPVYQPVTSAPHDGTTIGVTAPVAIEQPLITEDPLLSMQEDTVTCPDDQPFMAHRSDCHKYYICIAGLPVSISCPEQMAWDNESMQCTEEALLICEEQPPIIGISKA